MGENKVENNAINPNNNDFNNKTNTFNLVIGIATLLIALLGATFAYFSATARSAEGDVSVKSAYVSISYDGGTEIKASNLIPATQTIALSKYKKKVNPFDPETDVEIDLDYDIYANDVERRCVDAKGKEVCYVYQFTIESDGAAGEKTDILASIKIDRNEFDNLSYILYEVKFDEATDEYGETTVITDKYGFGIVNHYSIVSKFNTIDDDPNNVEYTEPGTGYATFEKPIDQFETGEDGQSNNYIGTINPVACIFGYEPVDEENPVAVDDTKRCSTYGLTNKEKHTYQLVIFLRETGKEQPEQGLSFEGTVSIEVVGGFDGSGYNAGQITGQE